MKLLCLFLVKSQFVYYIIINKDLEYIFIIVIKIEPFYYYKLLIYFFLMNLMNFIK